MPKMKSMLLNLLVCVSLAACGGDNADVSGNASSSHASLLGGAGAVHLDQSSNASDPKKHPSRFELKINSADATSVRLQWRPLEDAAEYQVSRDGTVIGVTIGKYGYFTDFDLQSHTHYEYTVVARDASGAEIGQSQHVSARTTRSTAIRTHYKVLAIAFNPEQANLVTERTYLKHRIQFLELASQRSAMIDLYKNDIVSSSAAPPLIPGTNAVNYEELVVRRDLPGLDGNSIVDLVERGDIDHVWVVRSPVEFAENALIGNRPIQGAGAYSENTWVPIPVKSSRSFFVNGYLPDERSYDAYSHMVEGIMTSISDGWPALWPRNLNYTVYTHYRTSTETTQAQLNLWERFRLTDGWNGPSTVAYASPGNANIGSSHFPPTTPRECADYCYFDLATWQRYVDSTADDWLSFPNFSEAIRRINGYEFGAFNHYVQGEPSYSEALRSFPHLHPSFRFASASYHQWWFRHLPHNPGVSDGKLNNWWPYLFDFNRFTGAPIDYEVTGFPETPTVFEPVAGELGTELDVADNWGYWNSQNGFSPGAKASQLSMVKRSNEPEYVKTGTHALKVYVENAQQLEYLGFGRNDVFYPMSRNAHWQVPNLARVEFAIKLGEHPELLAGTNPIVRLYKNGNTRIEFVPREQGVYANLFLNSALKDSEGWYHFSIPLRGDATWEKNVIGYMDPTLSARTQQLARTFLEQEVLRDLNYVEISVRSTTTQSEQPYDTVTYYIDGLKLISQ